MYLNKNFLELNDHDYLSIHLNHGAIPSGNAVTSLKDCRILTMPGTLLGESRHAYSFDKSQSMLPILGWFAVLDQLGKSYYNTTKPRYSNDNSSGIKKSLYYLCNFGENDQKTKLLYAFRNALIHDSSLISFKQYENGKDYFFRYDISMEDCVKSAIKEWDGNFSSISPDVMTLVNPRKIQSLAEEAYNKAFSLLKAGNLGVGFKTGVTEIVHRYLLIIHD